MLVAACHAWSEAAISGLFRSTSCTNSSSGLGETAACSFIGAGVCGESVVPWAFTVSGNRLLRTDAHTSETKKRVAPDVSRCIYVKFIFPPNRRHEYAQTHEGVSAKEEGRSDSEDCCG